jgi:hypothetical protein
VLVTFALYGAVTGIVLSELGIMIGQWKTHTSLYIFVLFGLWYLGAL